MLVAVILPSLAACSVVYGDQPAAQQRFLSAVEEVRQAAKEDSNPVIRDRISEGRKKSICQSMPPGGVISGWTGKVSNLDTNNEGLGVLEISLDGYVQVATWNNSFSDFASDTLIPKGPMLDTLAALEKGDVIRFSGTFVSSDDACFTDMELGTNLYHPRFLFRFSEIAAST